MRLPLTLAILIAAAPAFAQHQGHGAPAQHQGHGAPAGHQGHGSAPAAASAATKGYQDANARMHKDMDIAYSGDADVDFARGMIPHHQGAVDMARVVLAHGKDPELRRMAQEIVAAQEKEIAFFRAWLKTKGR